VLVGWGRRGDFERERVGAMGVGGAGGGRSDCLELRWHLTIFSIDSARERLCGETRAGTP
jgi:hypothetical protein